MTPGWRSSLFFLILAIYLLAGVLFATLTPNWQAPDEPAHYNYIRYLAMQSGFPELVARCYNQTYLEQLKSSRFPPDLPLEAVCYEFHQPPLYYLLATPIFLLGGGSLLVLRLLSVALGAGVVALAFAIGRTIFPYWAAMAYSAMAFVAFVPMHVAMMASVNNDTLAELILAALLLLLVRRLVSNTPASRRSDLSLGLLLGLGLITKTTVYIAVPLTAVALWLALVEISPGNNKLVEPADRPLKWSSLRLSHADWLRLGRQISLVYGMALAVALPWYLRNAVLYRHLDILGLTRHDAVVVGQPRTAALVAEVGWPVYLQNFLTTTFHSFWGQFGWMAVPMSERVYLLLTLLTAAAAGGLVGICISFWRSDKDVQFLYRLPYKALALMALTIILMGLGFIWYNLGFVQFQGRYLFPALIPLGLFFSVGLYEAFSPGRAWWLAGGLAAALAWVIIASLAGGSLNKWAILITSLLLILAVARAWLASRRPISAIWLMTAVYASLALLTLISPFWYVIPYLSP